MKKLIVLFGLLVSFSAAADLGDMYSVPGKIGRYSQTQGIFEVVGLTYPWFYLVNGTTVAVKQVKVGIDMATDGNGQPMSSQLGNVLGGVIQDKFLISLVAAAPDLSTPTAPVNTAIAESTKCLGKDFIYTSTEGNGPVCYVVQVKDVVIK